MGWLWSQAQMLLGADLTGILLARVIYAFLVIGLIARIPTQ